MKILKLVSLSTVVIYLLAINYLNAESLYIHNWKQKPILPIGWYKIDQLTADLNQDGKDEIAFLCSDGVNDLIIISEINESKFWNLIIVESIPTVKHLKYIGNKKILNKYPQLVLKLDKGYLVYGPCHGSAKFPTFLASGSTIFPIL